MQIYIEHSITIFIGSVLGFLFSLVLFYIKENIKNKKNKKELIEKIIKESEYNIDIINDLKNDVEALLRKIAADDREVFYYFPLEKFQKIFLSKSFNNGFLYDIFSRDEIKDIDNMVTYFNQVMSSVINKYIEEYRTGISGQKESLSKIELFKRDLEKYKKILDNIIEKINVKK